MGLRTALRQARVLTLVALAVLGWTVASGLGVFASIDSLWGTGSSAAVGAYVGQPAASGLAGLGVLAVFTVALLALLGELGESDPAPATWPPDEEA